MTKNIILQFLVFTLLTSFSVNGQDYYEPKKIKSNDDYNHHATNTNFPTAIEDYIRTDITAFDKKKTNIGASYEKIDAKGKTTLTIYIYPVGISSSNLLREEYLNSLKSISKASNKDLKANQKYCFYKKDGYKINGYEAFIDKKENRTLTALQIYQCGSWFLKLRVSSDLLDSTRIDSLNKKIIELFQPLKIVKNSALGLNPAFNVSSNTLGDSLFLGCMMSSGFKKMEWTEKNVDELERASGFPDLYLDMHIESLKDFINFADEHKDWYLATFTKSYIDQIKALVANDFLDEFIMEQFSYVAIVPDNKTFDFKAFEQWKVSYPIDINLNEHFYSIIYERN